MMKNEDDVVEEPDGYSTSMGFVKSRPENNDVYVERWKDDPWYYPIKRAHLEISKIAPGYNITQIKEKFWELRFYYSLPEGTPNNVREAADRWVMWAEAVCLGIDIGSGLKKPENLYLPEPEDE